MGMKKVFRGMGSKGNKDDGNRTAKKLKLPKVKKMSDESSRGLKVKSLAKRLTPKALGNIRILHWLIMLSIVTFISLSVIGVKTVTSMGQLKGSIDALYNDSVLQLIEVSKLKDSFEEIRFNVSKAVDSKFYFEFDKNVKIEIKKLDKLRAAFAEVGVDEKKKIYVDAINGDIDTYLAHWESFKADKDAGGTTFDDAQFGTLERKIDSAFLGILKLDEMQGQALDQEAKQIYSKNVGMLMVIIIVALGLIAGLIILVISLINKNIAMTSKSLESIAEGDLNIEISIKQKNEFSKMLKNLEKMREALKDVITSANDGSNTVEETSRELTSLSDSMSQSAEQVSMAIQDISDKSMTQLSSLNVMEGEIVELDGVLDSINSTVNEVRTKATDTGQMASDSSVSLNEIANSIPEIIVSFSEVADKVKELNTQIADVSSIVTVINDIAEQTSLLSLNARIEAARAGEHGRGFTVVADEIRKLSEETKTSSEKITSMINQIENNALSVNDISKSSSKKLEEKTNGIASSLTVFMETIAAFEAIIPEIERVYDYVSIASEKKNIVVENATNIKEMVNENTGLIQEVAAFSEELAASSEHMAEMSNGLKDESAEMKEHLSYFKI